MKIRGSSERWGMRFVAASMMIMSSVVSAYDETTPLVREKLQQPSIDWRSEYANGENKKNALPAVRKLTMRDSGRNKSLMFVENVKFRFVGDIGFHVNKLSLSLVPNDPAVPVSFDDPSSFSLTSHKGSVLVSGKELTALFRDHVLNSPTAPLRNVVVTTSADTLTLDGQLKRGKWIPFKMQGPMRLSDSHTLVYEPNVVIVDGVSAAALLPAANVRLDELLTVKAPGTQLVGNAIVLDANGGLFPPPTLNLTISGLKLGDSGLTLEFDDQSKAKAFPKPMFPSKSYILVKGGDVKFMRTMPLNVSLQLVSTKPKEVLDFCLYGYRDQVARGWLELSEAGEVKGYLANYGGLQQLAQGEGK